MFRAILITIVAIAMSACSSYMAPRYGVSTDNVLFLKQYARTSSVKVKVNEFTASKDVKQEIMCRLAGPVRPSAGTTFQEYIREALVNELLLAEAYSTDADITIDGVLESIDFDTSGENAEWFIKLKLSSNGFNTFTIDHEADFSTTWAAERACAEIAYSLVPAVQDLIEKIINHPEFEKIFRGRAGK